MDLEKKQLKRAARCWISLIRFWNSGLLFRHTQQCSHQVPRDESSVKARETEPPVLLSKPMEIGVVQHWAILWACHAELEGDIAGQVTRTMKSEVRCVAFQCLPVGLRFVSN